MSAFTPKQPSAGEVVGRFWDRKYTRDDDTYGTAPNAFLAAHCAKPAGGVAL